MEVAIPKSVPMDKHNEDQLAKLSPFGVVTAIHNEDRANDDIAWYAVTSSALAHARLWSQHWLGGPYAAAFYPCPDLATAQAVRDALERRDWEAAKKRFDREEAERSEMDSLDTIDSIDLAEIFGERGVENLYRR